MNKLGKMKIVALLIATVFILTQSNVFVIAMGTGGQPAATAHFDITKTVSKTQAKIGEVFEYTIQVSASVNTSGTPDLDITDVNIVDDLPDYIVVDDSASLPTGTDISNGIITIPLADMRTGQAGIAITIPVRFKPDTPVGYVADNTATVNGLIGDTDVPITATSTPVVSTTALASDSTWKIEKKATSGDNPADPNLVGGRVEVWYQVDVTGNTNNGMTLYYVNVSDVLPDKYYMTSYKIGNNSEVFIDTPVQGGQIGGSGDEIIFTTLEPGDKKSIYIKGYYLNDVSQANPERNTATATVQNKIIDDGIEDYVDFDTKSAFVDVNFVNPSYDGNLTKCNPDGSSGSFGNQNYYRYTFGDSAYFTIKANDDSNNGTHSLTVRDVLPPKVTAGYPFVPNGVVIQKIQSAFGIPDDTIIKAKVSLIKEDDTTVDVGTDEVTSANGSQMYEVEFPINTSDVKEILVEFFSENDGGTRVLNPIGLEAEIKINGEIAINGIDDTLYENRARLIAKSLDTSNNTVVDAYDKGDALALFKIEKAKAWLKLEKTADGEVSPDEIANYKFRYLNDSHGGAPASLKNIIFNDYVTAVDEDGDLINISERDIKKDGSGNYLITANAVLTRANGQQEHPTLAPVVVTNVGQGYKLSFECTSDVSISPGDYVDINVAITIDPNARYGYLKDKVFVLPIEPSDDYDFQDNNNRPSANDIIGTDIADPSGYLFAKGSTFVKLKGSVISKKYVHGDLDEEAGQYTEDGPAISNASAAPADGYWKTELATSHVVEGGTADYKLVISNNECNGPISDFIFLDNLPRLGDKMVKSGQPRGTQWQPVLINQIVELRKLPAGGGQAISLPNTEFHVFYSTKENPSRAPLYNSDFILDGSGGYSPYNMHGGAFDSSYDWNASLPADLTKVKWMMVKYDGILEKDDKLETRWKMKAPVGAPTNQIAYNSFAFGGTFIKSKSGSTIVKGNLLPAEPAAVRHTIVVTPASIIQIGDRVWEDMNKNGIQDLGEPGINGILVLLYNDSDVLVDYTRTANNSNGEAGYYKFTEHDAGNYTVKFAVPKSDEDNFNDYLPTLQNTGGDDALDSDGETTSTDFHFDLDGKDYRVFSTAQNNYASVDLNVDFGLYRKASIGDRVWLDTNGDGLQNNGEVGIKKVFVQLLDDSGVVTKTSVTDNNGLYKFEDLDPGNYKIKFINFDYFGNIPTIGGVGNDASKDSNIPFGTDFDYNATDMHGTITVNNVDYPDTTAGYRENTTDVITLLSGTENKTVDAGYTKGYVGNLIFGDKNRDGIYNAGTDERISEVKVLVAEKDVNASEPSGAKFISPATLKSTSGSNGIYGINGLDEGEYDVWFFVPNNNLERYTLSTPAISFASDGGDNRQRLASLSDISDVVNLFSDVNDTAINLVGDYRFGKISDLQIDASNFRNLKYDVGLFVPGKISGKVFEDKDYDDLKGAGDNLINDASAVLFVKDGSGNWNQVSLIDITNGTYEFNDLVAGTYKVGIVLDADKSDYGIVAKDGGADNADSDVNTNLTDGYYFTDEINIAYASNKTDVDAGFRLARIGNKVYKDVNFNGKYDNGEELIFGAVLKLLDADNGDAVLDTVTTTNNSYYFEDLKAGNYKVILEMQNTEFNILSLESLGVSSKDEVVDDSNYVLFSDDGSTQHKRFIWSYKMDENDAVFSIEKGENFKSVDFAFVNHGLISGMVFEDLNNNGIRDAGEPPISGLTITLTKPDNTTLTRTTDVNGLYVFGDLQENADYKVKFEKPSNHILSLANQGGDDTVDSDAVEIAGEVVIQTITLSSNDKDKRHNDAGFFSGLQIKGHVFNDNSKDGIFDANENLFNNGNVTVSLELSDGSPAVDILGNIIAPVQIVGGVYHFEGLPDNAGIDYKLKVDIPNSYEISPYKQGADDTKDSDFLVDTGYTDAFDLSILTDGYLKEHLDLGIYNDAGGDIHSSTEAETTTAPSQESSSASESGDTTETSAGEESSSGVEGSSSEVQESTQSSSSDVQVEIELTTSEKPSEVELITEPEGGEIEIDEDGNITFIPNDDFTGKTTVVIKVTYEDGTEEFIEFDITETMIAKSSGTLPRTGGVPIVAYIAMGLLPLSAGIALKKKH